MPATQPALFALQQQLVFPGSASQGRPGSRVHPPSGCELVSLTTADGTKIAGLFGKAIATKDAGNRPALLFFYGNGMCMADTLPVFSHFRSLGFNVLTVDYEGYGMSAGLASEAGCYAAADAGYEYLLTRKDINDHHLVAAGWSLGAAVAIDLASRRNVSGLMTFSAFTSIGEMSKVIMPDLPVGINLGCDFDNLAKIGSLTCPVFMVHGSIDSLVPPAMLDRLAKAANGNPAIVRVSGAGHNDLFQRGGDSLYHRVKLFVDGLPGKPPTSQPLHQ